MVGQKYQNLSNEELVEQLVESTNTVSSDDEREHEEDVSRIKSEILQRMKSKSSST